MILNPGAFNGWIWLATDRELAEGLKLGVAFWLVT